MHLTAPPLNTSSVLSTCPLPGSPTLRALLPSDLELSPAGLGAQGRTWQAAGPSCYVWGFDTIEWCVVRVGQVRLFRRATSSGEWEAAVSLSFGHRHGSEHPSGLAWAGHAWVQMRGTRLRGGWVCLGAFCWGVSAAGTLSWDLCRHLWPWAQSREEEGCGWHHLSQAAADLDLAGWRDSSGSGAG